MASSWEISDCVSIPEKIPTPAVIPPILALLRAFLLARLGWTTHAPCQRSRRGLERESPVRLTLGAVEASRAEREDILCPRRQHPLEHQPGLRPLRDLPHPLAGDERGTSGRMRRSAKE